jgi:hypothetical protein
MELDLRDWDGPPSFVRRRTFLRRERLSVDVRGRGESSNLWRRHVLLLLLLLLRMVMVPLSVDFILRRNPSGSPRSQCLRNLRRIRLSWQRKLRRIRPSPLAQVVSFRRRRRWGRASWSSLMLLLRAVSVFESEV